jgi:hypothetical protein
LSQLSDLIIEIGSRSGALFALVFFGSIFGMLGWIAVREARNRGVGKAAARILGVLVCVAPVLLVCLTSLNGFYGLTASQDKVTLTYLVPFVTETLDASQVQKAEARPAFKLKWRVHLVLASGEEHRSALSNRKSAEIAVRLIQARVTRAVTGPSGSPSALKDQVPSPLGEGQGEGASGLSGEHGQ